MPVSKDQLTSINEPIYRQNFFFFLLDNILFNLAANILGPTTLVPDFIRHLTRSEILIGLSTNIFEVGTFLPQLFIARYLVRFERMKWWFVGPNIPARLIMLVFPIVTIMLGHVKLEVVLVAFFACYGIAALGNGISNVPGWVLLATSLDNRWRARYLGLTLAIVGTIMLVITPLIGAVLGSPGLVFPNNYAFIFGASGLLFTLSILPVMFVHELPGGKAAEKIPSMREFLPGLGHVLRTDSTFRAILISRMFLALFMMASPYYIGFATVRLGLSSAVAVPVLLAMNVTGSIFGALIYTWLGARSNLMYIRLALAGAGLLPVSALLAAAMGPLPLYLGFLASGLTGSNILSGYSNWVITHAAADRRPVYAGLFNTVAALVSMVSPFLAGLVVQHIGFLALFLLALAMVLGALFVTLRYV